MVAQTAGFAVCGSCLLPMLRWNTRKSADLKAGGPRYSLALARYFREGFLCARVLNVRLPRPVGGCLDQRWQW